MTSLHSRRTAAAVALTTLLSSASAASPAAAAPPPATPGPITVTLVTGDRVTVARPGATRAAVLAAPGREGITFAVSAAGGHLRVVPSDAVALLRSGKVDPRLFDVTTLIGFGYDDAGRAGVPLIVRGSAAAARKAGGEATAELPAIGGTAITAPKSGDGALWAAVTEDDGLTGGVRSLWLDGLRRPTLDVSVPQIGAPAAWQAGYDGTGMTVAVLDTGVDAAHPDLAGRVTAKNFTAEADGDLHGHGTHVASTIAGDGAASGGKYRGVAPGARILAGKVCAVQGCPDSAILAGMQWAAVEQHAKVISMSLGGPDLAGIDPLEEAVGTLTEQTGALFVIAAGNSGDSAGTIESPGSADAALTVGAVDKSGAMAPFSSRGPRGADEALKPDVTAPGVDIVAARAQGTEMGEPAADFPGSYVAASGTSMATPHVAGAAILLAQQHPEWTADELKSTLMASAEPSAGTSAYAQGAGLVDLARAVTQSLTATPASVSFGLQKWPHDDDPVLSRTITYRNSGSADVTLDLAVSGAAEGLFALGDTRVVVPAKGSASTTVSADTRGSAAEALHSAVVTATAGSARVVTPVGVDKEGERYDVTLRHIGLDGEPTADYFAQIYQATSDFYAFPYDPDGTVTVRLPKDRYTLGSYLGNAMIFQPVLDLTADTTITLDAREAAPVSQSVPSPGATSRTAGVLVDASVDGGYVAYANVTDSFDGMAVLQLGDPFPMHGYVDSSWQQGDAGDAWFAGEHVTGEMLAAGYQRAFTAADFGAEQQVFHGTGEVYQYVEAYDDNGDMLGVGKSYGVSPGTRVNHYVKGLSFVPTAAIGTRPEGSFVYDGPYYTGAPRAAGDREREDWGRGPYGAAFEGALEYFGRYDDLLVGTIPAVGDRDGHSGRDWSRTAITRLLRGEEVLGEYDGLTAGAYGLPAEQATYRLEQSSTGGTGGLATRVDVAFTFESAAGSPVRAFAVSATPELDEDNAAPAGGTGTLPLVARDLTGSTVTPGSLRAQVSYDDGATWQDAALDGSTATVTYPAGSGFVSLRLSATSGTSAFEQTVLRAYRFR